MRTVSVPSRNYSAQVLTRDVPASVQRNFVGGKIVLTRESWPAGVSHTLADGTVVQNVAAIIALERTLNDGASWEPVASLTCAGGTKLDRSGNPILTDFMTVQFNDAAGNPVAEPGDLRVAITFTVALRTAITATLYDEGEVVVPAATQGA